MKRQINFEKEYFKLKKQIDSEKEFLKLMTELMDKEYKRTISERTKRRLAEIKKIKKHYEYQNKWNPSSTS